MITISQKLFTLCVLSVFLSFSALAQEGEHMTAVVTQQSRDTNAKQMYELVSQYRTLTKLGQFEQAIPLAKQSLSLFDGLLGAEHPDKAGGMFDLAWMYFQTRDYAKAEPLLSQVVAIKKQVLGENNPSYVSCRRVEGEKTVLKEITLSPPSNKSTSLERRWVRLCSTGGNNEP